MEELIKDRLGNVLTQIDFNFFFGARALPNKRINLLSNMLHKHFQDELVPAESRNVHRHRARR